jgi:murein DD-endopeptidase MepM/ murein hydrolase activator NlpD
VTDKQILAELERIEATLKKAKEGYRADRPVWRDAMGRINRLEKALKPVPLRMVFPIAGPDSHVFVGGLHETGGLPGNWAIDFICKAGLGVVAPEAGLITRFSGNDPSDDSADARGVYGWTTYLRTPAGYVYFITHQGRRYPTLRVGMHVQAGDLLGYVGDQRFRPDHAHVGVTSPKGSADAKKHITAVSKAPRAS